MQMEGTPDWIREDSSCCLQARGLYSRRREKRGQTTQDAVSRELKEQERSRVDFVLKGQILRHGLKAP